MNTAFKLVDPEYYSVGLYTWSEHAKTELLRSAEELAQLSTVIEVRLPNEPYGASYTITKHCHPSNRLSDIVSLVSEELFFLDPKIGLMLFSGLIFDGLNGNHLHALFALTSNNLNLHSNGMTLSLHSPIKSYENDTGFPVHADLFKSRALFNVISENNDIYSGQTLLIPIDSLYRAMTNTRELPSGVVEFIINVLSHRVDQDFFDIVFNLMHGEHIWAEPLKANIEKEIIMLPVQAGDGYFLIDGKWLHGRAPVKGKVTTSRLQRLTFDTKATLEIQKIGLDIPSDIIPHLVDETGAVFQKTKSIKAMPNKSIQPTQKSLRAF